MEIDCAMLAKKAADIRVDIIKEVFSASSGHPGGSLSASDILTILYFHEMNIDPACPKMQGRDKFVLSKGHAAPVLYGALAERGFFEKESLPTLRHLGSKLQGHPDCHKVPGVEMSTGSLGQGFSAAVGMALCGKLDQDKGRVYVLLGDGEIQEGIVWEAAMSAAHYKLDNLCVILDWNGLQIDGKNDEVMRVSPIDEKFRAFGFHVISVDGHDYQALGAAFDEARTHKGQPTLLLASTIKGKGVSFMENNPNWHGKAPNEEEARQAVEELGGTW